MSHQIRCAMLILTTGLLFGPGLARGQYSFVDDGRTPGYEVPPADPLLPIPLGSNRMELGGLYLFGEYIFMDQTRALGSQSVAFRGFIDATGAATGTPGSLVGSGREALSTDDFGRGSFQPGFVVGGGWKFEGGFTLEARYLHLFDAAYAASASVIPPFFRGPANLADNFVSSQVFNFPPQFNGPVGSPVPGQTTGAGAGLDTTFDTTIPGTTVGVWNAADVMDIKYTQRFSLVEITGRAPIFQSEYARTYGLAGLRYAWFWERFWWRTTDYDLTNFAIPEYAAEYTNILSQRLYGPFAGCGHEIYVGDAFALSLDVTGAVLMGVGKERVKYARADDAIQAKRSTLEYAFVPNINAQLNLWWYPTEGIQMRLGYTAMNFFNTIHQVQPIGFNMGAIDPVFEKGFYRLVHGLNLGIAFSF